MKTIVLASRKGGAGKTTLSCHLAVEAERAGEGPVALIDTDRMAGLAKWWEARAAETPALVRADPDLPTALAASRALDARYVVVDTAPAAGVSVEEAVRFADLVLVPVLPSPDDLRAIGETIGLIERARRPMVFVINRVKPRTRLANEAVIALSQHGTVAPVMVSDRIAYAAAKTDGLVAQELAGEGRAGEEMAELWAYVRRQAEKVTL